MEAQTDITTYLEQGRQALAQGQGRDAAIAYAHAAQLEPENPLVHLGLAEANLALGSFNIVQMACQRTQELAPSGPMHELAQALLTLLDRRYAQALQLTDSAIKDDPGNAYAHALRAYLLRANGQDYDAGLARSRASRLSFGGKFENCFPALDPAQGNGYKAQATAYAPPTSAPAASSSQPTLHQQQRQISEQPQSDVMRRRMIRTRFWLAQNPRFLTFLLVGINVLIYLVMVVMNGSFSFSPNTIFNMGGQLNAAVSQGQFWRIFTSMFLHFSIIHIGFNMLSLFFVGSITEILYGKWRYLLIYLLSGIVGGIASYFLLGTGNASIVTAGASGAIFGAFGALGAFFLVNRRALGPAANSLIGQWVFWLVINIGFDFSIPGVSWQDHLGGLLAGMVLGILLLPPLRQRSRRV